MVVWGLRLPAVAPTVYALGETEIRFYLASCFRFLLQIRLVNSAFYIFRGDI